MNNLNEIEKAIVREIESIKNIYENLPKEKKNNLWITNEIFIKIGDLGKSLGYEVASKCHPPERLCDLVWYKNMNGYLSEVNLVLESELSSRNEKELRKDFEKLHMCKAKTKVMISFAGGNRKIDNIEQVSSIYKNSFKTFNQHNLDERILILIWDDYMTGIVFHELLTL